MNNYGYRTPTYNTMYEPYLGAYRSSQNIFVTEKPKYGNNAYGYNKKV